MSNQEELLSEYYVPLLIDLHPYYLRDNKISFHASIRGSNKQLPNLSLEDICGAAWGEYPKEITTAEAKDILKKYLMNYKETLTKSVEGIDKKIKSL